MPYCSATLISVTSACADGGSATRAAAQTAISHAGNRQARAVRMSFVPECERRDDAAGDSRRAAETASRALVESRQHEFTVAQRLGRRKASVGGPEHHIEKLVACLVHRDLSLQKSRGVKIDVLAHRAHCARVGAKLDHRQDRVPDDVALA